MTCKRIFCVLFAALVVSVTLGVGWLVYHEGYRAGQRDPDWTAFNMWIDIDNGIINVESNVSGCGWVVDPCMIRDLMDDMDGGAADGDQGGAAL